MSELTYSKSVHKRIEAQIGQKLYTDADLLAAVALALTNAANLVEAVWEKRKRDRRHPTSRYIYWAANAVRDAISEPAQAALAERLRPGRELAELVHKEHTIDHSALYWDKCSAPMCVKAREVLEAK